MNNYTYRAEWSQDHRQYVCRCIELPWLSQWALTMPEAIAATARAVDDYVADRSVEGDRLPPPLTEQRYSGKFIVRTSPALHARLAVEAAEQNVSLNQWVIQRLANQPPVSLLDW
ncbi:type II toxin-antitoxin system HicB family antitoxin [Mycobacterium sp. M1]|uniref:Type II toxin-antitoxin system HicB family antitoxin n=1 Tax=Mycolicibacter acidiphilus TaxID=2835306 RepID=A0ABS5RJA3_9MYCO|nr:type II toxin-antitoxin system HicB family antitoxin [Mycolicibacter acidiphilus]MBS9534375.1 type II toxin-antitoxin system HicB family antitoxin [Mycolicibacter acidiphilus]